MRKKKGERHGVAHSERSATCIRFGVEARQDPLSGKVHTGRSVPPSLAPTSLGGRLSQPFLPFFQCRTHWLEEGPSLALSLSPSHRCRYNSRYKPREEISSRKYASSHTERTQPPRYLLHYPAVFSSITDTSRLFYKLSSFYTILASSTSSPPQTRSIFSSFEKFQNRCFTRFLIERFFFFFFTLHVAEKLTTQSEDFSKMLYIFAEKSQRYICFNKKWKLVGLVITLARQLVDIFHYRARPSKFIRTRMVRLRVIYIYIYLYPSLVR